MEDEKKLYIIVHYTMLGINEIKKDNLQQYKFLRDRKLFTSNFRIKILRADDINV